MSQFGTTLFGGQVKAGQVFHIRIHPKDIVGCVRVCEKSGLVLEGASLARHISYALRVLLESARASGAIPSEEDPFTSFAQVQQKFKFPQVVKLQQFAILEHQEIAGEIADQPVDLSGPAHKLTNPTPVSSPAVQRIENKIKEVYALQQADPINDRTEEVVHWNKLLAEQLEKERNAK